jgi:hypothetical protein
LLFAAKAGVAMSKATTPMLTAIFLTTLIVKHLKDNRTLLLNFIKQCSGAATLHMNLD